MGSMISFLAFPLINYTEFIEVIEFIMTVKEFKALRFMLLNEMLRVQKMNFEWF